jgi:hypothetical protein
MRAFWRLAVAVNLMLLMVSAPGHAACGPGAEPCEPSMSDARAKVEKLLNAAYVTPHAIMSLERFDGRGFEDRGRKIYEMRMSAVMSYSGESLTCRTSLCPELTNYLVEIDKTARKATISGWLFFEQSGQGWR